MRHKAAEITHNINNTLGPGTANEHTVQEVLQRRWALKMSIVVSHQKLTMTNWEPSLRLIILQLTTWEVANVDHSMVMWRFSQMGKVRKLDKWVPHELVRMKKKNRCFEVLSSLILCNNEELFLYQIVMCEEKWTLYNNWRQPAQWLDWEEAPKHFPKLNLHGKRVMVTIWWSAAHLIHYSFLNANKTIASEKCAQQIDENRKLQHLQPALVNRRGPSASSPDLSPADYHSFTHLDNFLQGKVLPQPVGGRKCFPRVHWIWSMDFYTTEINSHIFFSWAKMCWF